MLELNNLFSDIQWVTENPVTIKTQEVFKEGNKIKTKKSVETFILTDNDLLSELRKAKKKSINYHQAGFKSIFKKVNTKELENELNEFDTSNKFIIMSTEVMDSLSKSKLLFCEGIVIDDRLMDEVIIGSKLSKCIINKDTKEYYINLEDVSILSLI